VEAHVRPLRQGEAGAAASLLARSFADDPFIAYFFRCSRRRRLALPPFFAAVLHSLLSSRAVFASEAGGRMLGVAAWLPPEPVTASWQARLRAIAATTRAASLPPGSTHPRGRIREARQLSPARSALVSRVRRNRPRAAAPRPRTTASRPDPRPGRSRVEHLLPRNTLPGHPRLLPPTWLRRHVRADPYSRSTNHLDNDPAAWLKSVGVEYHSARLNAFSRETIPAHFRPHRVTFANCECAAVPSWAVVRVAPVLFVCDSICERPGRGCLSSDLSSSGGQANQASKRAPGRHRPLCPDT
jgi:hypothetical protein